MRSFTNKTNSDSFKPAYLHPKYWPLWLGVGLLRLLSLLPHTWKLKLGVPLGRLLYHTAKGRRRIAQVNIQLAFPDWSAEKQQALVKAHFESLGISLMELLIVWWGGYRHNHPQKEEALVSFYGLEHVQHCQDKGQGVILLVPHFTHLEMTGLFLQLKFSYKAVYRPHDDPLMEHFIKKGRTVYRQGQLWVEPISKDNTRGMLRHLKKGGLLFYLPDQRFRHPEKRIDAPFFNHPAPSNPATSKLAHITGAAVVPVFTRRIGSHYHVTCLPPLEHFPSGDDNADLIRLHQLYEKEIKENPAQYLWVHDRWNLKP